MTSGDNDRDGPASPGDGVNLLIGWRAGGEKAAGGGPAPEGRAEDAADTAAQKPGRRVAAAPPDDEPGTDAAAVPEPGPAATMSGLAAGQRRILALLEELTSKHAASPAGDAGTDLGEAAASIRAATEWASDIRAAIDAALAATGKSIRDLNAAEQGLGEEAAALKTRAGEIDGQIEALGSGARVLGTRLRQLDEARQNLDTRSAELQAVKQEIVNHYGEWTAGAVAYRREMAALTKRLDEGENLVARVEPAIGPWTERIGKSLDENAGAQKRAAAETSGNVQRLAESGDAFLERFGAAWNGALEDFRTEWRRTRRWSVPVMAAVLVLMLPTLPVMGALGQSKLGVFAPYDDTGNWKEVVWERHGAQVKKCLQDSMDSREPVFCSFEARW